MRLYEEHMKPVVSHIRTICDNPTCGRRTRYGDDWENREHAHYQYDRIRVERIQGSRYPSGGDGTSTRYDLCPECFEKLIAQPLQALGIMPHTEEIDE